MDSGIYLYVLILIAVFLLLIPFAPAWIEWKIKTDAEPFIVNLQDRNRVDYVIRLFKEDIIERFQTYLDPEFVPDDMLLKSEIAGEYHIVFDSSVDFTTLESTAKNNCQFIIFTKSGELPSDISAVKNVYAANQLSCGANLNLDAVYGEHDISLAANTFIKDFIYAGGAISVDSNAKLNCYTKAMKSVTFYGPVEFQYIYGHPILFGTQTKTHSMKAIDILGANLPRKLLESYYSIKQNTILLSHLLVKAPLRIGNQCIIVGNIKAYDTIIIGSDSAIIGSIFGQKNIQIGDDCYVQGPIVAEGTIWIGRNCIIGTTDSKTSVVAQYIHIKEGCYFSGQILAEEQGYYRPNDETETSGL